MQEQVFSSSPKPSVLVTGSTGLVGSHLIAALVKAGYNVAALYRTVIPDVPYKEQVQWVKADILDILSLEDAMHDVQQVYHCAAIVSFSPADVEQMMRTNVEGASNVVNAALTAGVDKLVYVSSVAALGRTNNGEIVNETMQWTEENNTSHYSQSKFLAEMEVWRGIGERLKAAIVNPSIILGNGNWETGSTKLFKSVYEEFPWYSEGTSGFVDVADVVKAMIMLMESNITGERFIVNGINCTYREVFNEIARGFGKKAPNKKVTPLIASLVWRAAAIKSLFSKSKPLVTKETALAALMTTRYDNSKIINHLPGFSFTPLRESIERICKELSAKHNLQG